MKRSAVQRRPYLRLMLVLLLVSLAVPAAPAAADHHFNDVWSLNTAPVTISRDGVDYRFKISATETVEGEDISVLIFKRRNPDGVAVATQWHRFVMDVDPGHNRFTHPELNLSRAGIDTGNEFGVYGMLDLNFNEDGPVDTSCGGHNRTRTGTLSGTVNFKTGTEKFGTITKRPLRATLRFEDGECGSGGPGPGNACPLRTRTILGQGGPMFIAASKVENADRSTINVYSDESLRNGEGFVAHETNAVLPPSHMGLGDGARTGRFKGLAGTWLSGEATFNGPPAENLGVDACGSDRESFMLVSNGQLTGDFAVQNFVGPDHDIGNQMDGTGTRVVVRPQS